MMTENQKNTNQTASAVLSPRCDREPAKQLSLWDYVSTSEDGLTTQYIKERFSLSSSEYREAIERGFLELDAHVILYKGRNHWRVISLMKA